MTDLEPDDDSSCFVVKFETDSKGESRATLAFPESAVRANAKQLSKLIETLGRVRLNMLPEIDTAPPDLNQKLESVAFPPWQISLETMTDGILLHLRHPGFGWLAFVINGDDLISLRDTISDAIAEIQDQPARSAN
ncbi:hypothetical protein V4C53_45860 [Paraburkholderia azotifigens]|uniref:hypothetical protein n=1 Tax=Paraburkholderia azotifigens TaxID=2057004 RepID=UPI00316C8059